ncbi:hypothetical protein C8J57DRAFT_1213078 [Mycena rebaudengoi]|nr:hypothetical protein C8J57DRAFT_1213078 [Mycena rebaudengoi]
MSQPANFEFCHWERHLSRHKLFLPLAALRKRRKLRRFDGHHARLKPLVATQTIADARALLAAEKDLLLRLEDAEHLNYLSNYWTTDNLWQSWSDYGRKNESFLFLSSDERRFGDLVPNFGTKNTWEIIDYMMTPYFYFAFAVISTGMRRANMRSFVSVVHQVLVSTGLVVKGSRDKNT